MANRVQSRPSDNWVDPRLRMLVASPYIQGQLRVAGLVNQRGDIVTYPEYVRGLARQKHRRHDIVTREIVARALKIQRSGRASRRRQFESMTGRVLDRNAEFPPTSTKKYRPSELNQARQKSAPGCFEESKDEEKRVPRVSSVHQRKLKSDNDLPAPSQLPPSTEERHACQVTMSYKAPTESSTAQSTHNEIIVLQQHSNGENLIVFRGFIGNDESFTFKSQRRSTSPLTLAFYANGLIDSMIQECCEYKYRNGSHLGGEHGRFDIDRIRKANPCEKCRKEQLQRAHRKDAENMSTDSASPEKRPHAPHRRRSTPSSHATVTSQKEGASKKQSSSSKSKHDNKKTDEKKHPTETLTTSKHDAENASASEESVEEKPTKKQSKQKQFSSKSSSHENNTEKKPKPVGSAASQSKVVHEPTSGIPFASSEAGLPSSTKEHSKAYKSKTIDGNKSPTLPQDNTTSQTHAGTPSGNDGNETTTGDEGNSLQTLLAFLQKVSQSRSHQNNTERREKSVENFVYVLDGSLQLSNDEMKKLRGLLNFGATFDDINDDACLKFLNDTKNEQVLLIISRVTAQNLNAKIRAALQVRFIYVIGSNNWPKDREKIRGVHIDINHFYSQLVDDLIPLTHDLTMILSVSSDDTTHNSFAYVQILKEILLESDKKVDLKEHMLTFCRQEYADNEIQLKLIDEFEHHFRPDKAVDWYMRRDAFVFKMLTRAFRIPDPDILFKLRFFIQILHSQLLSKASIVSPVVYRCQHLSKEDLNKITKHQGGFLAFSQFFTAHKDKTIAKQAIEISLDNLNTKLVMFQIDISCEIPSIESDTMSGEVLFTAATVFRISSVEQSSNDTCLVKLTVDNSVFKTMRDMTKGLREATHGPFPLLRMAKLMKEMKYKQQIERFCHMLIDDPEAKVNETSNMVVGGLLHSLGTYYYERKEYDRALDQLKKSLKVYVRVISADDVKLTPTYNNMGSIYLKQGFHEKALEYHRKAYDLQVKSSSPDLESVAAYAGNIGGVYIQQGKFEEAVQYLQRDLKIQQRLHPNDDNVSIAAKHHNLAGAYFRLKKFTEALEHYQMCLDLELKLHPSNHPTVAVTYHNMATAFEGLGQLQQALEVVQKALERLLMTKTEDDEEVKMNRTYETRLKQKLWVKEMFTES